MYFLYFSLICYSILATVNTYVLLAADMADFRSIAKKFGPSNLADQIEDLVQDKFGDDRDEQSDRTAEYSDDGQSQSQIVQSYEVTTERPNYNFQTEPQPKPFRSQNRYKLKSAPAIHSLVAASPIVPPGLNLDEIVERVKQKLQEELLNRKPDVQDVLRDQNVNAEVINTAQPAPVQKLPPPPHPPVKKVKNVFKLTGADNPAQLPIYETPVNVAKEEQYETTYEEHDNKFVPGLDIQGQPVTPDTVKKVKFLRPEQGIMKKLRFVKKVAMPAKPIQRQPVAQVPQIPHIQEPKPVQQKKVLQKQRQRLTAQKPMKKKRRIRVSGQTTPQTPAPQNAGENAPETENMGVSPAPGIFEAVDLIKSNDSYEDYVTPEKEEAFESDGADTAPTVPTAIIAQKFKVTPTIPTKATFAIEMEPLAEDIETAPNEEVEEYADESPETTTIEPKAKTESISFEEGEVDPNATTIAEVTVKGQTTKKIKMGTMIPTREYYKQSSPNYYAKLPTIAEKYNFQEPIPEADRVPENLKPIGSPPSSINGKVILI
nr:titin [Helicoverpa armigera]